MRKRDSDTAAIFAIRNYLMHHAGVAQYGQQPPAAMSGGVAASLGLLPHYMPPAIATSQPSTAALRQWRKKDDAKQCAAAAAAAAAAPSTAMAANTTAEPQGPIARVAPHAHYPRAASDIYAPQLQPQQTHVMQAAQAQTVGSHHQHHQHQQRPPPYHYPDYSTASTYKDHQLAQVKYSEIVEPHAAAAHKSSKEVAAELPPSMSHAKNYFGYAPPPPPPSTGFAANHTAYKHQRNAYAAPNDYAGLHQHHHHGGGADQLYNYGAVGGASVHRQHMYRGAYRNYAPQSASYSYAKTGGAAANNYAYKMAAPPPPTPQPPPPSMDLRRIYESGAYGARTSPNYQQFAAGAPSMEYAQHYQNRYVAPTAQQMPKMYHHYGSDMDANGAHAHYHHQHQQHHLHHQQHNTVQQHQATAAAVSGAPSVIDLGDVDEVGGAHASDARKSLKQYLETWNEDAAPAVAQPAGAPAAPSDGGQLYILDSTEIPSESVGEYIHLQVDKLPANIKGYLSSTSVITSAHDTVIRGGGGGGGGGAISVISETKKFLGEDAKVSGGAEANSVIVFGEHKAQGSLLDLDENRNHVPVDGAGGVDLSVIRTTGQSETKAQTTITEVQAGGQDQVTPGSTLEAIPRPLNDIERFLDDSQEAILEREQQEERRVVVNHKETMTDISMVGSEGEGFLLDIFGVRLEIREGLYGKSVLIRKRTECDIEIVPDTPRCLTPKEDDAEQPPSSETSENKDADIGTDIDMPKLDAQDADEAGPSEDSSEIPQLDQDDLDPVLFVGNEVVIETPCIDSEITLPSDAEVLPESSEPMPQTPIEEHEPECSSSQVQLPEVEEANTINEPNFEQEESPIGTSSSSHSSPSTPETPSTDGQSPLSDGKPERVQSPELVLTNEDIEEDQAMNTLLNCVKLQQKVVVCLRASDRNEVRKHLRRKQWKRLRTLRTQPETRNRRAHRNDATIVSSPKQTRTIARKVPVPATSPQADAAKFLESKHNFSILAKEAKTKTKIKTPSARNRKLDALVESSMMVARMISPEVDTAVIQPSGAIKTKAQLKEPPDSKPVAIPLAKLEPKPKKLVLDTHRKRLSLEEYKRKRCDQVPMHVEENKMTDPLMDVDTLLEKALDAPSHAKLTSLPSIVDNIHLRPAPEEPPEPPATLNSRPVLITLDPDKHNKPKDPRIQKFSMLYQSQRKEMAQRDAGVRRASTSSAQVYDVDPRRRKRGLPQRSASHDLGERPEAVQIMDTDVIGKSVPEAIRLRSRPRSRSISPPKDPRRTRGQPPSESDSSATSSRSESESGSESDTSSTSSDSDSSDSSKDSSLVAQSHMQRARLDLDKEIDDIFSLTQKKFEIRPRHMVPSVSSSHDGRRPLINLDEISDHLVHWDAGQQTVLRMRKMSHIDPDDFNLNTSDDEVDVGRMADVRKRQKNIIDLNELLMPDVGARSGLAHGHNVRREGVRFREEGSDRGTGCEVRGHIDGRNLDDFINKEAPTTQEETEPEDVGAQASYSPLSPDGAVLEDQDLAPINIPEDEEKGPDSLDNIPEGVPEAISVDTTESNIPEVPPEAESEEEVTETLMEEPQTLVLGTEPEIVLPSAEEEEEPEQLCSPQSSPKTDEASIEEPIRNPIEQTSEPHCAEEEEEANETNVEKPKSDTEPESIAETPEIVDDTKDTEAPDVPPEPIVECADEPSEQPEPIPPEPNLEPSEVPTNESITAPTEQVHNPEPIASDSLHEQPIPEETKEVHEAAAANQNGGDAPAEPNCDKTGTNCALQHTATAAPCVSSDQSADDTTTAPSNDAPSSPTPTADVWPPSSEYDANPHQGTESDESAPIDLSDACDARHQMALTNSDHCNRVPVISEHRRAQPSADERAQDLSVKRSGASDVIDLDAAAADDDDDISCTIEETKLTIRNLRRQDSKPPPAKRHKAPDAPPPPLPPAPAGNVAMLPDARAIYAASGSTDAHPPPYFGFADWPKMFPPPPPPPVMPPIGAEDYFKLQQYYHQLAYQQMFYYQHSQHQYMQQQQQQQKQRKSPPPQPPPPPPPPASTDGATQYASVLSQEDLKMKLQIIHHHHHGDAYMPAGAAAAAYYNDGGAADAGATGTKKRKRGKQQHQQQHYHPAMAMGARATDDEDYRVYDADGAASAAPRYVPKLIIKRAASAAHAQDLRVPDGGGDVAESKRKK